MVPKRAKHAAERLGFDRDCTRYGMWTVGIRGIRVIEPSDPHPISWINASSANSMSRLLTAPLVWILRLYQASLSVLLGPACRFEPTCSRYAELALKRFGLARGSWLTIHRLARCHPLGGSGYDPIPERAGDGS